jgi:hypothetical protein
MAPKPAVAVVLSLTTLLLVTHFGGCSSDDSKLAKSATDYDSVAGVENFSNVLDIVKRVDNLNNKILDVSDEVKGDSKSSGSKSKNEIARDQKSSSSRFIDALRKPRQIGAYYPEPYYRTNYGGYGNYPDSVECPPVNCDYVYCDPPGMCGVECPDSDPIYRPPARPNMYPTLPPMPYPTFRPTSASTRAPFVIRRPYRPSSTKRPTMRSTSKPATPRPDWVGWNNRGEFCAPPHKALARMTPTAPSRNTCKHACH